MYWLSGDWNTTDYIIAAILAVIFIVSIYQFIQWVTGSRNYRDSADDHALGCLRTLSWGCWLPLTVMILLVVAVLG